MLLPADVAWLMLMVGSSSDSIEATVTFMRLISSPAEAASGNVRREAADT